ncbi:endo-1,4-beta-xylanase [Cellulosimicrobium cellulans]|uniref:endo-1,4-beta-xylanase n=1 Tax=Cellulosimicrobium cellulans TaxID=1710 RepID=UPI0011415D48|nr:endo-1,4-beta-xylanase [Cellulosimicrobium cellulans]
MRRTWRTAVAGVLATLVAGGGASAAVGMDVRGAQTPARVDNDIDIVLENDFESAATTPWAARGPVTVALTGAEAHGGSSSLAVTGRTADWHGVATDALALLEPGVAYDVEAWVKLPAGTAGSSGVHFTVQETGAAGTAYTWVGGAVATTADGWVEIGGTYTLPADLTSASLYVEAAPVAGTHPSFLLDDVRVTTVATDPGDAVPGGAVNPVPTPVRLAEGTGDVAALTFDDGPNPGTTPALLDFLAEHDLHAVFCVIGQNVRAPGGAELLRRIVDEGHVLCNHSTGYADMGGWSADQVRADLVENLGVLRDALGDPQYPVPFFRAPNGSWGATPEVAVALGMQPLAVVNTISDWETQDVATLTANLRAAMKPGEVVLAHDGGGDRAGTLAAVETVVAERLADGWEFTFPVGTPPRGGEVLLETGFEDGLGGWVPRAGDATTPSLDLTDVAHGGTQAAVVTGRDGQGDGIGHDVTGLLAAGTTYELSAWVRFAEGQPADDVWLSIARTVDGATSYSTLAQISGITSTGWTQVTATFPGAAADEALLYLETDYDGDNTSDLLVDDVVLRVPPPPAVEDLTGIKETVDVPVGVAIDSRETSGAASELLLRHFDQVTAENHMKPEAWYDEDRTFRTHPEATALMDYAAANDLRVYGHVLVWHSQTPAWFFEGADGAPLTTSEADRQVLRDRLRTHVFSVAQALADAYGPFGGDNPLTAFDVVNEVVSDGGENPDGLRRSEWFRILGEEYLDLAFAYADEAFNDVYADPAAKERGERPVALFINDYNTEQGGKQDRYHALVERLLARGVPVDGVGHQFHVSLAMPVSALEGAIERFADLPVTQAVTELDVTTGTPVTQASLVEQGYYYRDAFRVFRAHADDLYSVTVWGLTDGRSWRVDDGAPLVFDDALKAKPAYHGVVDGELPARLRTADVFAGDVPLDGDAAAAPDWQRLPLHRFAAPGAASGGDVGFQLRWAPDHLTAFASVDDATEDAADAVTFALDGDEHVVGRDGATSAGVFAEVTERPGGYDVVAHLPLDAAAAGDTLALDVRATDAGADGTSAWNTPGATGTLRLLEELSYLEVAHASAAPAVDGEVDAVWAEAGAPVTTAKEVQGSGGAVATVRTLWRDRTLYVLAQVADPVVDVSGSDPWVQDSVEVYVDAGNAKNGAYRDLDTQVRVSAENAVSFGTGDEAAQRARVTSATTRTADGYVVELAVDLADQGGEGTFHGLDLQVNDASGGTRTAIRNWADPSGAGYQSTARWGVARLVGAGAAPEVALDVEASARCLAGKAYVAVRATNREDVPVDVTLTTPYGSRTFTAVAPGANAYQSFAVRATSVPAGTATVTGVLDGGRVTSTRDVAVEARTC